MHSQLHYLQTLSEMNYSPAQKQKWKNLCDLVNQEELSMNQAYNRAKDIEFMEDYSPFNGSFNDWMQTAKEEGWVTQALGIAQAVTDKNQNGWGEAVPPPVERKNNTGLIIGVTIGVIAIGAVIVLLNKKD